VQLDRRLPRSAGVLAQVDSDGDGVGDRCDPRPGLKDRIAYFNPFTGDLTGWNVSNATISNDQLHLSNTAGGHAYAYPPFTSAGGVADTFYTIDAVYTNPYRSVEVVAQHVPNMNNGYRCMVEAPRPIPRRT
jgi:hypothetical protein